MRLQLVAPLFELVEQDQAGAVAGVGGAQSLDFGEKSLESVFGQAAAFGQPLPALGHGARAQNLQEFAFAEVHESPITDICKEKKTY